MCGQAKGSHQAALVERSRHVGDPLLPLFLDPALERLAKGAGEDPAVVIAGGVGAGHDRAEVAQRYLVDDLGRRFGPIAPLGCLQLGEKLLGHGHEGTGLDLGLALLAQTGVLGVDGLAHGRDAAPKDLLGDGALLGSKRLHDGGAVGVGRSEPLGLGCRLGRLRLATAVPTGGTVPTLRTPPAFGSTARGEGPAGTLGGVGAGTGSLGAWKPVGPRPPVGARGAARGAPGVVARAGGAGAPTAEVPTAGASGPGSAVTTVAAVTVAAAGRTGPLGLGHQRRRHPLVLARGADDLEAFRLRALLLARRQHGGDEDALDLEIGVGAHHVADLRTLVEQRRIDHALGLLGPCGAPRPSAVALRTRELDFDAATHLVINLPMSGGRDLSRSPSPGGVWPPVPT